MTSDQYAQGQYPQPGNQAVDFITYGDLYEIAKDGFLAGAQSGWVKLEDGLPEFNVNVLGLSNLGKIAITCVDGSGQIDDFELEINFDVREHYTHWMPLPDKPKV